MSRKSNITNLIHNYRLDILKTIVRKDETFWQTIKNIRFNITPSEFRCAYVHQTDSFNPNDYCHDTDSENDGYINTAKETILEFGYVAGQFYIARKTRINVYTRRDSPDVPRLYNIQYESELDEHEQYILLYGYSNNRNIPEWLIIAFFDAIKSENMKIREIITEIYFE